MLRSIHTAGVFGKAEPPEHKKDERYRSVMDLIVRANQELFMEVKKMCRALEELMADELEAMRKSGWEACEKHGNQEGILRFAKLSGILLRQNQQEQLLRASEDEAYRKELFQKYNI